MCGVDRWAFETRYQTDIRGALAIKWKGDSEINHGSAVADTPSDDPQWITSLYNPPHPVSVGRTWVFLPTD